MSAADDAMVKLVRKVRGRMILARVARSAVVATFAAAAVIAMLLISAALWPSLAMPVHVTGVVTALIVTVWSSIAAARGWPDDHHVARHIDHELGLHELLASALACSAGDDAAARSLRAMAYDVAARTRAADVRVHRPSIEAAAAAMLCFAGVMIAAALLPADRPSARGVAIAASAEKQPSPASPPRERTDAVGANDAPRESKATAREHDARPSQAEASATATGARTVSKEQRSDSGQARGGTEDETAARFAFSASQDQSPERNVVDDRAAQGGAGSQAVPDQTGTQPPAAGSAAERQALATSVEQVHVAAHEAAAAAIAAGRVPDRCRDLVRAYFDVDTSIEPSQRSARR